MEAEIKRKAEQGVALSHPTPEKQALYNQYKQQAQATKQVAPIQPQRVAMQSQSQPQMQQPMGQAQQWMQQQQQAGQIQQQQQMQALVRMLQQSAQSQFSSQQAMLGQARDAQIAQLEKAYADAVAQGEISVREAQQAFEEGKAEIDKNAYMQAQQTQLMAQDRGIQNSQQLLGHMSADEQSKMSMINQNMTTRDKRVADIKDRIRAVQQKKDLDISSANRDYNYGLAKAKGDIDARMYQAQFQMGLDDYKMNRQENFETNKMGYQQLLDFDKMDKQNTITLGQMAYSHGLDLQKMDKQQVLDLAKMAKEQGYRIDLSKLQSDLNIKEMGVQHGFNKQMEGIRHSNNVAIIDKQGNWDLKKMATQHGYDMSKMNAQQKAQIASINAQAKAQANADAQAYEQAMQRELNKHTPGTKEYKIMQGQIKANAEAIKAEIHTKALAEANAVFASTLPKTMPSHPGYGLFDNKKKVDASYNAQVNAYRQYENWMKTGSFNQAPSGLQGATQLKAR